MKKNASTNTTKQIYDAKPANNSDFFKILHSLHDALTLTQ